MNTCELAIIGAGPYGLSIAAHLKKSVANLRIFGEPMDFWIKHMPQGMCLKSEGFASSLSDPGSSFTLRKYCEEKGLPYGDHGVPVPLEVFCSYGLEFQKRFVPELERVKVVRLEQASNGFRLTLEGGQELLARRVVMAVGIGYYPYLPPQLTVVPKQFVTHSSAHSDLEGFRGRRTVVVGAGASALELAALLHEAGSAVEVITRSTGIRFQDPPRSRALRDRISRPTTGIGNGWQLFFYVHAPRVFRLLPKGIRLDRVLKTLGPAPAWFTRDRVVGKVPLHIGLEIARATVLDGRVVLELTDRHRNLRTIEADHVIAATGYRVDLERLDFLSADLRDNIRTFEGAPSLSDTFESSVPGLYFVGVTAANTFGPLMRFAYGTDFAARHLSSHLGRRLGRTSVTGGEKGTVQVLQQS